MSNAYIPTRQEAQEYLDTLCFWKVFDIVDPQGALSEEELDTAMLDWAYDNLTQHYRELAEQE